MINKNKELIERLYNISTVIFNLYNKIKINQYLEIDNEENLSNLKMAIEHERYIYNNLELDENEVYEIMKFLEEISPTYTNYDLVNDITDNRNIEEENYFEIIEEERDILINQRIKNNLDDYLVEKVEISFEYEDQISQDEYQDYTGVYVRKFKQLDSLAKKHIDNFMKENKIEFKYEKDYIKYINGLKKEALEYLNYALNIEHVIVFNENVRRKLEYLASADFYLSYIKKLNKCLSKDSCDVIDQTYNLSFLESLIEDKIIFGDFLKKEDLYYIDELDSNSSTFVKIVTEDKYFYYLDNLIIKLLSGEEITIFDKMLMELIFDNFNEEIINYTLEKYSEEGYKHQAYDISEFKHLLNKKLNKPKTKSKALIKNNNMLK